MQSIKNNDIYEETIKYSKFISLIYKVYNKEEVKYYIEETKKHALMPLTTAMDM